MTTTCDPPIKAVEKMLAVGTPLIVLESNVDSARFLARYTRDEVVLIDGTGGYLHGDFSCPLGAQTRDGSLQFARDVAEGLLGEIAEFVAARAAEAEVSATVLVAHLPQE